MWETTSAGWRLEEWAAPAGSASGDFVICRRAGSKLQVFVGDATGHGERAAAVAAAARGLIERDADEPVSPHLLRQWNRELDALYANRFACLTYVEIDAAAREVTIANAGNPPVMIVRGRDGRVDELPATGMPVGLIEDDFWRAPTFIRTQLDPADSIVCFTDGLPDLVGPREQRFGMDRVLSSITHADDESLVRSLGESVESFVDHTAEQDDLTILCIEQASCRAA
jgi:sigma-B regulation protein RsbU (phosphoserine phosphatase)